MSKAAVVVEKIHPRASKIRGNIPKAVSARYGKTHLVHRLLPDVPLFIAGQYYHGSEKLPEHWEEKLQVGALMTATHKEFARVYTRMSPAARRALAAAIGNEPWVIVVALHSPSVWLRESGIRQREREIVIRATAFVTDPVDSVFLTLCQELASLIANSEQFAGLEELKEGDGLNLWSALINAWHSGESTEATRAKFEQTAEALKLALPLVADAVKPKAAKGKIKSAAQSRPALNA